MCYRLQEVGTGDALHCIQTAMTVLSGPQGSSLNIDPLMFYNCLYKNLQILFSGMRFMNNETFKECCISYKYTLLAFNDDCLNSLSIIL